MCVLYFSTLPKVELMDTPRSKPLASSTQSAHRPSRSHSELIPSPFLPTSSRVSSTRRTRSPSASSPVISTRSAQSTPSKQQRTPTLPQADVVKAPALAMYYSRTPVSGRNLKPVRAHSAAVVGNDLIVIGGCDSKGSCFKEVWKLDTDTFIWTKPKAIGESPPPTRAHTCTIVDSRLFLIAGGDGPAYFNDVFILDTRS